MSQSLQMFLDETIRVYKPQNLFDFLNGYLAAAEAFAIWKDGEQLLGIGSVTMRELREAIKDLVNTPEGKE